MNTLSFLFLFPHLERQVLAHSEQQKSQGHPASKTGMVLHSVEKLAVYGVVAGVLVWSKETKGECAWRSVETVCARQK